MPHECTLSVICMTVLDGVPCLLFVICSEESIMDSDVYGRGVMEVRSIYHLWEPGVERLRYIRVTNNSIHVSSCLWSDVNIQLQTWCWCRLHSRGVVIRMFNHVAMAYVCSRWVDRYIIHLLIILGNSVCQFTIDSSLVAVPPRVVLKFSFDSHPTCRRTRLDSSCRTLLQ